MNNSKKIFVYYKDFWLGTIYVVFSHQKEIYSFEYSDEAFLNRLSDILPEEEILFVRGRQYKDDSSLPYHFLKDSSPDRWGMNLIKRGSKGKTLNFSDYLLLVSDKSRMGALRYKLDNNGEFESKSEDIPPLKYINEIEQIAYNYDDFSEDDKWRILLSPGSSLGGARPKANFYDNEGNLYLAKFNHKNDFIDVSKLEYLIYKLAISVGINMSDSKLIQNINGRSVFLTKRFDRNKEERIHYVSFMSLLSAMDGESYKYTYIDMAETIKRYSFKPINDLKELFKRIAFSIIVNNTDNHLRNHGMLFANEKWTLSPAFDINMNFDKKNFELSIDGSNSSLKSLIDNSLLFGTSAKDAIKIIEEMKTTIFNVIEPLCKQLNIEGNLKKAIVDMLHRADN